MYIFIGGIPASGKTYLAKKVAEQIGAFHFDLDTLRKEMANDPKLEYWVNLFFNQDEEKYLEETSCEEHWQNLVKQSEAFWPTILNKINEIMKTHESAIFEGVNIMPHLAKKDFSFPGIFLLGESLEQLFERNKQNPRWGKTEELQGQEAALFFNCDRPKYQEEAVKYGYKVFTDSETAENELISLLNSSEGSNLVKQGYNKIAEKYSATRDQFSNIKYLEKLVGLLKPGATVLDIGCGAGVPVDKFLAEKGFKVLGLDFSEKQIEPARNNVPQATFEVEDMMQLQNGEYEVDAVVSFYAIFHTPREGHMELFKKINSFLPRRGYILITMGFSDWEGTEEDFHGTKMWWSHFGADKNIEIVKNAGFRIIFNEIDNSGDERHLIILARKERVSS